MTRATAQIVYSSETIAADAVTSLNAAFEQIFAESGIRPRVLAPYGGDRTEAQQAHLVATGQSDTMNSDHRLDAAGRAAVDIDNQEELRHWNNARFEQIMADHGWHNMTNEGKDFPTEPWHFAKHGITAADSNINPIDPAVRRMKDIDMPRTVQVTSDPKAAPKYHGDYYLIQPDTYVLRKVGGTSAETEIFDDTPDVEAISDARLVNLGADFLVPAIVFDALKTDTRPNAYLTRDDWAGKTTEAQLKPLVKVSAGI